MYIQKITIENIRGFDNVDLDLTRPDGSYAGWTVIAGRNGSGKTTLLRAVALSVAAVSTALTLDESYSDGWVRKGAKSASVKARVQRSSGDRVKKGHITPSFPESFWTGLEWEPEREPELEPLIKLNQSGQRSAPSLGPCAEKPTGWFMAAYGSFRRIAGETVSAQRLMRGPARIARLVTLFREEASLAECVGWLQQIDYRSKESRPEATDADALKQGVLRILRHGLLPDHAEIDRIDSDGLWVRRGGVLLLHTHISDGYKTITALVLDLLKNLHAAFGQLHIVEEAGVPRVVHHGVVLIDEVDAHLHVSWQKRIGFWLKEHFPNIQFIVTTHSPYICQAADPNGIIRLAAPGDSQPTGTVPDDVYNIVVNGSADDAVMTELFGRERPYSDNAEELRAELSNLESLLIQGKASKQEKAHLKELSSKFPKTMSAEVERALFKLSARLDGKTKVKP